MTGYLIGEVCQTLKIKPHILRYWEQQIPLLNPRKDRSGRRVYTDREMQILFRLRYLIKTRKFTTEGAAGKIIEELNGAGANRKAGVQMLREQLMRLSADVHNLGDGLERLTRPAAIDERQPHLLAAWPHLPVRKRLEVLHDLQRCSDGETAPLYAAAAARRRPSNAVRHRLSQLSIQPWQPPHVQRLFPVAGLRPRALLLSLCAGGAGIGRLDWLLRRGVRAIEGAERSGFDVESWIIAVDPLQQAVFAELAERLVPPGPGGTRPVPVVIEPLPLVDEKGLLYVSAERDGLAAHDAPLLVAARVLTATTLRGRLNGADGVVIDRAPDSAPSTRTPRTRIPGIEQLLGWFEPRSGDLVATAVAHSASSGLYRPVGALVVTSRLLVDAVESGAASAVTQRVYVANASAADIQASAVQAAAIQSKKLYGLRLRAVDLLTRARRPRIFLLQEPS